MSPGTSMGFFWVLGGMNAYSKFTRHADYEQPPPNGGSFIGSPQISGS